MILHRARRMDARSTQRMRRIVPQPVGPLPARLTGTVLMGIIATRVIGALPAPR